MFHAPVTLAKPPNLALRKWGRVREYYVYIMSNPSRVLYTGVTNDLERRVAQHKARRTSGFTRQYVVTQLVDFEPFGSIHDAIAREKQIKSWSRARKVRLILSVNPEWRNLSQE